MRYSISVSSADRLQILARKRTSDLIALKNTYTFKISLLNVVINFCKAILGLLSAEVVKTVYTGKGFFSAEFNTAFIASSCTLSLVIFCVAVLYRSRHAADILSIQDLLNIRLAKTK
ncbi:MAG: hypothetical protein HAW67_01170 [Endozoicomonadaceae bacterium]|nr:hypothetical protein [Endozoicomonadaceae bacterium]